MPGTEGAGITYSTITPVTPRVSAVALPNVAPVRLQTLDLARHIAVAPDGRSYVVATYEDKRMGRAFVTAVFPQQNGYLTLVRLMVCELLSQTPDQAVQRHIDLIQTIQQGKLKEYVEANKV